MRRLMMTRAAIPATIKIKQAIVSRVVMSTEVSNWLLMSGGDVSGVSVSGLFVPVVRFRPGEVKLLEIQAEGWALIGKKAVDIIGNPYMRFVIRMRTIMIFVAGESS